MELTAEDLAILAHVVVDPAAWAAHAEATVGAHAVRAKIARYRAAWLAVKDVPGYQTRAERDPAVPPGGAP